MLNLPDLINLDTRPSPYQSGAHLSRVLPPPPGSDWVDLGCGPGLYIAELSKQGYHLTGIDQSENSIQYARTHTPDPIVRELYSDLTGAAYHEESACLGLICQKADQSSYLEPVNHE